MSIELISWAMRADLAPAPKVVLIAICDQISDQPGKDVFWGTQAWLAEKIHMHERQVREHLKTLEDLGVITRQKRTMADGKRISDLIRVVRVGHNEASGGKPPVDEETSGGKPPVDEETSGGKPSQPAEEKGQNQRRKSSGKNLKENLKENSAENGEAPGGAAISGFEGEWGKVQEILYHRNPAEYASWFGKLTFKSSNTNQVILLAPNAFIRNYIDTHLSRKLADAVMRAWGEDLKIIIKIGAKK